MTVTLELWTRKVTRVPIRAPLSGLAVAFLQESFEVNAGDLFKSIAELADAEHEQSQTTKYLCPHKKKFHSRPPPWKNPSTNQPVSS